MLKQCFSIEFDESILSGKSKKIINIRFIPKFRCSCKLSLDVLVTDAKQISDSIINDSCTILAVGDHPTLRVMDVRNAHKSVQYLYENFNIYQLNNELEYPLTVAEVQFNKLYGFEETSHLECHLSHFDWDFGKVTYGTKESIRVIMTIKNIGGVLANFQIKWPEDLLTNAESWAELGQPSEEQQFEKQVLSKKIFEIIPRKGTIKPGEIKDIELY